MTIIKNKLTAVNTLIRQHIFYNIQCTIWFRKKVSISINTCYKTIYITNVLTVLAIHCDVRIFGMISNLACS